MRLRRLVARQVEMQALSQSLGQIDILTGHAVGDEALKRQLAQCAELSDLARSSAGWAERNLAAWCRW